MSFWFATSYQCGIKLAEKNYNIIELIRMKHGDFDTLHPDSEKSQIRSIFTA